MLKRFNIILEKYLYAGTAVSSILFFLIVILSVMGRYLRMPVLTSIELSRLFFVWSCFLAAALTYRRRAHVGFTLLVEKMPGRVRYYTNQFVLLIIMAFLIITLYHAITVTVLLWPTDLPMLGQSQSWFMLPVPLVCAIMASFTLEFIRDAHDLYKIGSKA